METPEEWVERTFAEARRRNVIARNLQGQCRRRGITFISPKTPAERRLFIATNNATEDAGLARAEWRWAEEWLRKVQQAA